MKPNNYDTWNDLFGKKLLLAAMSLALLTHGVILFYTLPKTYDAFVHIFFADHYAREWFEPWEYRWYTGFLTTSYPPLVHQSIALLSNVFPLKIAFCMYAIGILQVLIVGVYRFTKLFFNKPVAGVAALITVLLSSIVETLHVYGQLPTLTGLAFLLNALPFLYQYMVKRKAVYLLMTLAFLSVVICSHHVTAIFGMVLFIAPTIFMALTDGLPEMAGMKNLRKFSSAILLAALKRYKEIILFGISAVALALGLIFPYWYWSKTDPIIQVSIPHGSRDNFFEHYSSALIFYIIPLILVFALLPAIVHRITREKRFFGWAVSFFLCLLLGSGGTTPLPKLILGTNAFNILTLDRFGFWASVIAIPFMAKFIHSFLAGPVRVFWTRRFGKPGHFILSGVSGFSYFLFLIFIFHLASFRPLQPKEIEIQPILNFLNRDDHMRWRYLALGFGDQMAWLSANSVAATVDGNYHSARRLPELTSRPVERLDNAKFTGNEGLSSLNDFLTEAEKYSLKYVFSNDRYYDPLLYYTGWSRTIRLENGIVVWEKGNIPAIKPLQPAKLSPLLKRAWGIFPVTSLCIAILLCFFYLWRYKQRDYFETVPVDDRPYPPAVIYSSAMLPVIFFVTFIVVQVYELLLVKEQKDPETAVINYYNHVDFQRFENAFHFFKPSPAYPLDQYLLEKSVKDGGLLSSFAKLDSIAVKELSRTSGLAKLSVYTRWRTSVGLREKTDSMELVKIDRKWYLEPPVFTPEIPEEQMRSYTFTVFKKQGKRVISSFPTVKDDRVKKPFAAFRQVNLVKDADRYTLTGEILNADDIPVNISLKVIVRFKNDSAATFYPGSAMLYNLSPKALSAFDVPLGSHLETAGGGINSVEVWVETDVSERGYIHGGTPGYSVSKLPGEQVLINTRMYDELASDINIPGILISEKDDAGRLWQTQLYLHHDPVRSGLHTLFNVPFQKIQHRALMLKQVPITVFINGQQRAIQPVQPDKDGLLNNGITLQPHCFISSEIYLQ